MPRGAALPGREEADPACEDQVVELKSGASPAERGGEAVQEGTWASVRACADRCVLTGELTGGLVSSNDGWGVVQRAGRVLTLLVLESSP